VTLTEALADLAVREVDPTADAYLRVLTLTNVAAAIGSLGRAGRLIANVPFDESRPTDVAFLTAMQLHARTQDDFHPEGRSHVGIAALAPTLALADRVGDRTLQCVSAGYEVMCAVAMAYSPIAQRRGYRPTGMFGPLGAAAAAAVALDLDRDGIANAIGLASTMSAGTNQSWISGTDEWLLELGAAARAGVEAALLTEAGAISAPVALEGPAGWARAFFDDADGETLQQGLSTPRSRITEVATKPYPVSGIAQVVTQLGCDLNGVLEARDPDRVVVTMSDAEVAYPGSANRGPFRSRSDALMSVAFCVACAIRDGFVALDRLENPNDVEIRTLIERLELRADADMPETEASIEVTVNGEVHTAAGEAATLLFPGWSGVEAEPLARRSEASVDAVALARRALEPGNVAATELSDLLARARSGL
jgi:2-methylcitrate dehydratase PrpD